MSKRNELYDTAIDTAFEKHKEPKSDEGEAPEAKPDAEPDAGGAEAYDMSSSVADLKAKLSPEDQKTLDGLLAKCSGSDAAPPVGM